MDHLLYVVLEIVEAGTTKRVCPAARPLIDAGTGALSERARLPGGDWPARVRLVEKRPGSPAQILDGKQKRDLPVGEYEAIVRVHYSDKEIRGSRPFHVGETPHDLFWTTPR